MHSGLRGRHITSWDDYNTSSHQLDNALKLINVLKYPCIKQVWWSQLLFLWKICLFCPVINRWKRIPCTVDIGKFHTFRGPENGDRLIVSMHVMHIGWVRFFKEYFGEDDYYCYNWTKGLSWLPCLTHGWLNQGNIGITTFTSSLLFYKH